MHVLVTGGCGFIGSRLTAHLLASGHSVVVLDNLSPQIHGVFPTCDFSWADHPRVTILRGDVGNQQLLDKALEGVEAVAHLAAETGTGQSMYEIAHYNAVNSQATALLLERIIARKSVTRVVLSSSRSIYGEGSYVCRSCAPAAHFTPQPRTRADMERGQWEPNCPKCGGALTAVATREDAAFRPASIYAATKAAQEDLLRISMEAAGISAVILRFQNVYGEGQSLKNPYTGIISIFSTRLRRGLVLPLYEDGLESRDFVHVDDVVEALAAALFRPFPGCKIFNIGAGLATSVHELASTLAHTLNFPVEPIVTGEFRIGDIRHCFADITAARAELDFEPKVDLREGLKRFAAWVLSEPLPEDQLDRATAELKARGLMARSTN